MPPETDQRAPPETSSQARARWRRFTAASGSQAPDLRIGLAASFTAEPLVPLLGAELLARGFTPAITLAPYGQIFQVCQQPAALLPGCEVIVIAWRIEDLLLPEALAFLRRDPAGWPQILEKLRAFVEAITALRAGFVGGVVVALPPFPAMLPAPLEELAPPHSAAALHRAVTTELAQRLAAIEGVLLWDLDAPQRELGLEASLAFQHWYLYRQPFADPFLFAAAKLLARLITASRRAPRKCIILDADNTLWGGIIGEDGLAGIQLSDDFPGSAYRDFQRLLLHWHAQGVLLAIASKNNEADVWEVFDRHDGMLLRREHLATWRIDWQNKSDNIALVAADLNIGLESLVFIDDNPLEIESLRAELPAVECVLLPEDPAEIVPKLRALTLFDRTAVTAEDRSRTEMLRAERARREAAAPVSHADFLQTLQLEVTVTRAEPPDLERIAQLVNKTNQFNLTTRRRTLEEIRALATSPRHRLWAVRVRDRFGDYGLTGVAIAEATSNRSAWLLDTFLLSCRVLGRGVETAVLAAITEAAKREGISTLQAHFLPTAKNAPAKDFLPSHGFQPISDEAWELSLT